MAIPSNVDYLLALKEPEKCLVPGDLKGCVLQRNKKNKIISSSGARAIIFKVQDPKLNTDLAIRCFTKRIDLGDRYTAISSVLSRKPYCANFTFYKDGITLNNEIFPILTMNWVQGSTLDSYLEKNLNNCNALEKALYSFLIILWDLKNHLIAHGDLQHGNIIVNSNNLLYLVDFDNMYVPHLKGMKSNELGHPNYQHPLRSGLDFHEKLDYFSSWVILCSIMAIMENPAGWPDFDQQLVFNRKDFINPGKSKVFQRLTEQGGEFGKLIGTLLLSFSVSPYYLPSPADFIIPPFEEGWVSNYVNGFLNYTPYDEIIKNNTLMSTKWLEQQYK